MGAEDWLAALPAHVEELAQRWNLTFGRVFEDATEAFVVEAGVDTVLKVGLPTAERASELAVLRLTAGDGCVKLLAADDELGGDAPRAARPLAAHASSCPCSSGTRSWSTPRSVSGGPPRAPRCPAARTVPGASPRSSPRPTRPPAARARSAPSSTPWRAPRRVRRRTTTRGRCSSTATSTSGTCSQAGDGWKLVDPDGLLAEPEYDLGVIMRENPEEDDLLTRASWLAARTGLDPVAIWEWGVAQRVSTGLLATRIGLQPVGAQMLARADEVAELWNP